MILNIDFKKISYITLFMVFYYETVIKFILLLQKVVHPHECMDHWENLKETLPPENIDFYVT